jgi:hypothetical protein
MPSRSKELEGPLLTGVLSGEKNPHKRCKTVVEVSEVANCRQTDRHDDEGRRLNLQRSPSFLTNNGQVRNEKIQIF